VNFWVSKAGMGWRNGEYGICYPLVSRGWPTPRWYQRSVRAALAKAVRYADRRHAKDQAGEFAMQLAAEAVDDLQDHADALAILDSEFARP